MSLTELTFWIMYASGLIGALFNPVYGVLLYIMLYNLNPETQWWGANVEALGLRTSLIVAIAIGIGTVLNWRPFNRQQSQCPPMLLASFLFTAYVVGCTILGLQLPLGEIGEYYIIKLVKVMIFLLLMIRCVRTLQHFRWMLWAWMCGTIYIGYQAWSGTGHGSHGRMLTGGLGGPDFADPSGLSAHLIAMTAIAGYLFYSSKTLRGRFFALLAAALAVNTNVMTRTRNAFPGAIVLILFGILRLPRGVRVKCGMGVLVGLVLALQLTDEGWWERMATMKNPHEDTSIAMRFSFWRAAIDMSHDHPFGVGPGNYQRLSKVYIEELPSKRAAHSTYFQCLAELGYPGLLIFALTLFLAFVHYERARSVGKLWDRFSQSAPDVSAVLRELLLVSTACEVALAGFLTCSAFTTRLFTEGMWLLLGMSCCLHNISRDVRASLATAPVEDGSHAPTTAVPGSITV